MKAEMTYTLETNDGDLRKRLGECLNMLQYVFTHHPELRPVAGDERRKLKATAHPHKVIFNNAQFTSEQVQEWSDWVDKVIEKGREVLEKGSKDAQGRTHKQHPAYIESHKMALDRFREEADAFLELFHNCHAAAL